MQAKSEENRDCDANESRDVACDVALWYNIGLQVNNVVPPRRIGGAGNTDLNIQPEAGYIIVLKGNVTP